MKAELIKTLALAAFIALGAPAMAQEEAATGEQTEAPQDGETDLSMGEPAERQPGTIYVDEVFDDWERRCAFVPDSDDPCHIYQLIKDVEGAPMADITIVRLPAGQEAAAGATIIAPLEVLLTQQLTLGVDSATAKRYPFRFCTQIGCASQIGFTAGEIAGFKAGNVAKATIVPAIAPDQKVLLEISLKGFTAAYDSLPVPVIPPAEEN